MIIIGIDPGISGAICFFQDGQVSEILEMPVMAEGKKNKRQIKVENTLKFLTEASKIFRKNINTKIISITGSCGKTTLKELLGNSLNKISKSLWKMRAYDKKSNSISIELKYSNKDKFIFNFNNLNKVSSINPFGRSINKLRIDPRCFYIKKYINDNLNKKIINNKYFDFINFWKKVEIPNYES